MLNTQLGLTGLILFVAVALAWIGQRFSQKSPVLNAVLAAFGLLLLVWIPREALNYLLIGLGGIFFGSALGGFWAGLIGAGVILLFTWILGGSSIFLLGLLALVCGVEMKDAIRHLRRLSRAEKMQPGKIPSGEVGMGGRVYLLGASDSPLPGASHAVWHVKFGDTTRQSRALLEVRGEHGSALVDPSGASLDLTEKELSLEGEEAQKVVAALDLSSSPKEDCESGMLHWVEEGAEVYVMGLPTWEVSPQGVARGYRESPMLPVFRAKEGCRVYLADRSAEAVRQDSLYTIFAWAGWGVVCVIIALAQLFFS